jgi:hypothetical protein
MNQAIDPRTLGFNYGPGWGSEPKPPIYNTAMKVAFVLGREATKLSAQAWALEMAIRDVRLASRGCEKAQAVAKLETALAKHLPPCVGDQ